MVSESLFDHSSELEALWALVCLHLGLNSVHRVANGPGEAACRPSADEFLDRKRHTHGIVVAQGVLMLKTLLCLDHPHFSLEELEEAKVDSKTRRVSEEHCRVTPGEPAITLSLVDRGYLLPI